MRAYNYKSLGSNIRRSISLEPLEIASSKQHLENRGYLIYLTIIGSLGGVLLGYDLGVIGVASLYMYDGDSFENPGSSITALITSIAILGCAIGTIMGGIMGEKYGRKQTIIIGDLFMIVGEVVMTSATHLSMLIAGRFIIGLGIGILCTNCPNYLSEAAPDSHRGLICGTYAFFIAAARLLTLASGVIFQEQWRFMFAVGLLFSVGQLIGFIFLPESPIWLSRKNRVEEAKEALARIRLPKHKRDMSLLKEEIRAIKLSVGNCNNEPYLSQLKSLFKNCRKQTIVGSILQIFQQFTGFNIAMYYAPTIVHELSSDVNKVLVMLMTIPIFASTAIGTGIGIKIMDKAGRRSLLLRTIPGIIFGLLFLSVMFAIRMQGNSSTISILIIIGVIIYVGFFGLAMAPIPWTINTEIYPTKYTSVGSSVAATSNWVANAIIIQVYGSIADIPICSVLVWVVAAMLTTFCWLFVYFVVPETKGKSQTEIQALFEDKKDSQILNIPLI